MAVLKERPPGITSNTMLDEESMFEHLLHSPQLVVYFEEMGQMLQEEHKKRQQFYGMITADQKAEFINGKMIMHSPATLHHNLVSSRLYSLLHAYVIMQDLGLVGHEKLMISLTRNDYEPDVCFFCKDKAMQFVSDQWQFPAPDFIAEVLSKSTENKERRDKFLDYAAHGVTEYWIIDPIDNTIEQYHLQEARYKLLRKVDTAVLQSIAVRGFELPVRALFDENTHKRALQQFVASLSSPARVPPLTGG